MLQAIIFDVDGTMADTENIHRAAFNSAFAAAGLDWHWDQTLYGRLLQVTGGKERIGHFIDTVRRGQYSRQERDGLVRMLHASKTNIYNRLIEHGAAGLRPGIGPLIAEARADGVKLAIATTTSPANVFALLQYTLGGEGQLAFEAIVAGDSVAHKKPAPDAYLDVLKKLKLPPASCIAIEDSRTGLCAALAAGITTVVTPSCYTVSEDFRDAALVVPTLAEVGTVGDPPRGSDILKILRSIHAHAIRSLRVPELR